MNYSLLVPQDRVRVRVRVSLVRIDLEVRKESHAFAAEVD